MRTAKTLINRPKSGDVVYVRHYIPMPNDDCLCADYNMQVVSCRKQRNDHVVKLKILTGGRFQGQIITLSKKVLASWPKELSYINGHQCSVLLTFHGLFYY